MFVHPTNPGTEFYVDPMQERSTSVSDHDGFYAGQCPISAGLLPETP